MIPFNRPGMLEAALPKIQEALASGKLSGDGAFCRRAERMLEEILGTRRALATTSCTHALEMSALLLDLAPGDEVILPSFTFVATAHALQWQERHP